jgi:hypothetical protein
MEASPYVEFQHFQQGFVRLVVALRSATHAVITVDRHATLRDESLTEAGNRPSAIIYRSSTFSGSSLLELPLVSSVGLAWLYP